MKIKSEIGHSLVKALRSVPGFASLDDRDLLQIVGVSINLHWPSGSTVFTEGAPAEGLYIVLSGCVRILVGSREDETEVASIGPGEFFGELSLLEDRTHSKNARATEDSELMILPKESFRALLEVDEVLAQHVKDKVEERLRDNQARRSA
jgi:CRP/FNR family transcriptional regulator, cyclic AMP receptor protein